MSAGPPRPVQTRLARLAAGGPPTSLLSVPAATSLDAVGFEPVGDVMGACARRYNGVTYGGCGRVYGSALTTLPVRLSSHSFSPFRPYATTLRSGYGQALTRLLAEATALGADGVVGVTLTRSSLDDDAYGFTALGTAVRGRSRTRAERPFSTGLSGTDVAKLLLAGWTPLSLQVAVEIGVRHDDYVTAAQTQRRRSAEVDGYTELLTRTRESARAMLRRSIATTGGDGGILSDLASHTWAHACDHVAQVVATGTAIARFSTRVPAARTSTMLSLKT